MLRRVGSTWSCGSHHGRPERLTASCLGQAAVDTLGHWESATGPKPGSYGDTEQLETTGGTGAVLSRRRLSQLNLGKCVTIFSGKNKGARSHRGYNKTMRDTVLAGSG